MRLQTCTPAVTPRGRPRQTMKTPYSRVNSIKKLHPGLQEIINNCPALDIIFDHDSPRSSTHSRSRGRDKEHVARPPNAFMVYRSYVWYTKQLENKDEKNLSCVSRLAGRSWRVLSEQARTPFKQVATIAKREHAERNPDYKYAPSSRSSKSQRKPGRAGSRAKGKAKVKQTATPLDGGFDASPPPREVTPFPSAASLADVPFASSESSPFPSSPSSPSPSTPPALSPRRFTRGMSPSFPQLEYPSDCDLPDYPPRPRFRPTMLGLIPSPSMSILELNEDEQPSILDQLPEVGPPNLGPSPSDGNANPLSRNMKKPSRTTTCHLTHSFSTRRSRSMVPITTRESPSLRVPRASTIPASFPAIPR